MRRNAPPARTAAADDRTGAQPVPGDVNAAAGRARVSALHAFYLPRPPLRWCNHEPVPLSGPPGRARERAAPGVTARPQSTATEWSDTKGSELGPLAPRKEGRPWRTNGPHRGNWLRKIVRQQEMDRAIAEGRLTVRTMTAEERAQSDARWTAAATARASGRKTSRYR